MHLANGWVLEFYLIRLSFSDGFYQLLTVLLLEKELKILLTKLTTLLVGISTCYISCWTIPIIFRSAKWSIWVLFLRHPALIACYILYTVGVSCRSRTCFYTLWFTFEHILTKPSFYIMDIDLVVIYYSLLLLLNPLLKKLNYKVYLFFFSPDLIVSFSISVWIFWEVSIKAAEFLWLFLLRLAVLNTGLNLFPFLLVLPDILVITLELISLPLVWSLSNWLVSLTFRIDPPIFHLVFLFLIVNLEWFVILEFILLFELSECSFHDDFEVGLF